VVRIIYSVCGEGQGHNSRSKVVIDHLIQKEHLVKVICSKSSCLNEYFDTENVSGREIKYENNSVNKIATFGNDLLKAIQSRFSSTRKVWSLIEHYKPDLIITDFDPFSSIAWFKSIPLISIDHQHVISNCDIDLPYDESLFGLTKSFFTQYLPARRLTNNTFAKYYFTTSFYAPKIKKKLNVKTTIVGPILREEVLNQKVENLEHVLLEDIV